MIPAYFPLHSPFSKLSGVQLESAYASRAFRRVPVVRFIGCLVEALIILHDRDDIVFIGSQGACRENELVVGLFDNVAVICGTEFN